MDIKDILPLFLTDGAVGGSIVLNGHKDMCAEMKIRDQDGEGGNTALTKPVWPVPPWADRVLERTQL